MTPTCHYVPESAAHVSGPEILTHTLGRHHAIRAAIRRARLRPHVAESASPGDGE
jgi:hypothetical protein